MNYNRRATRPDGLYYRESRKRRPMDASRPRLHGSLGPVLVGVLAIAGLLVYWLVHH
jgi:hypothetical protein